MLAGRGPTSGAEEAGTLGASPCRLPCPEGPKLGIWVPGPLGAPRKSVQEGAVSILRGSAAAAQRNRHLPRPGCAGAGVSSDSGISSSQALSATWFSNRRKCEGSELRIDGQGVIGPGKRTTGAWFHVHLLWAALSTQAVWLPADLPHPCIHTPLTLRAYMETL